MLHDLADFAQVIVGAFAGIFVAWYWNRRTHLLAEYRYLDKIYWKLLDAYAQRPEFGDENLTSTYEESFRGNDAPSYHYFAMRVHTVLETIYDIYHSKIPDEWIHIFEYHAKLHARWLEKNYRANEPGYVERVLGSRSGGEPLSKTFPLAPLERASTG